MRAETAVPAPYVDDFIELATDMAIYWLAMQAVDYGSHLFLAFPNHYTALLIPPAMIAFRNLRVCFIIRDIITDQRPSLVIDFGGVFYKAIERFHITYMVRMICLYEIEQIIMKIRSNVMIFFYTVKHRCFEFAVFIDQLLDEFDLVF